MPPAERIAVLDKDGTLWLRARTSRRCSCSAAFEAAADRPALAEQPVVKALLAGDLTASRLGRTVVSMRRDWNRVFAG